MSHVVKQSVKLILSIFIVYVMSILNISLSYGDELELSSDEFVLVNKVKSLVGKAELTAEEVKEVKAALVSNSDNVRIEGVRIILLNRCGDIWKDTEEKPRKGTSYILASIANEVFGNGQYKNLPLINLLSRNTLSSKLQLKINPPLPPQFGDKAIDEVLLEILVTDAAIWKNKLKYKDILNDFSDFRLNDKQLKTLKRE